MPAIYGTVTIWDDQDREYEVQYEVDCLPEYEELERAEFRFFLGEQPLSADLASKARQAAVDDLRDRWDEVLRDLREDWELVGTGL